MAMLERAMTSTDYARQAKVFLQQSDDEFARGDDLQASEKLWGAATYAVRAVAEERGWDHGKSKHRREAIRRLAGERNEILLTAGYSLAEQFHAHFYNNFMEDDAIEHARPIMRQFIHRILPG